MGLMLRDGAGQGDDEVSSCAYCKVLNCFPIIFSEMGSIPGDEVIGFRQQSRKNVSTGVKMS